MILKQLPKIHPLIISEDIPHFSDHCLYVQSFDKGYSYPRHTAGLGLVAVQEGKAVFEVNEEYLHLDSDSFVFLNKGSQLSIKGEKKGVFIILYFNNVLSELITDSLFQRNPKPGKNIKDYHDYSLIEHVHYANASLKNFLPLLIDLGTSCASFHALKADMLIRTILDNVILENFEAIQVSSKLGVVKNSTRVSLYKRLSMVRAWVEQNHASSVTVEKMADVAMLNPYHFLRVFKKTYGLTPHQYLIEVRLDQAQVLLSARGQSVSSVCHAVGFDSLSSFSRLFKARVGVSPKFYRETNIDTP
ncbi:AraC family transcriptional regulator [Fulvivirga ulvae]|uniref:helix-turn-helix domain-containing protein n=1 Tax=Fulvivirga ulvae TaxID=2904245 RepID=UPI001F18679E|nr:AraC family transcriptional regulator [Fulvivirga ulvae]UII33517.1 AraC family transcriptional regulator [Fulvivirga ulvae]